MVGSYFFSNSPVRWRFTNVVLPAGEAAARRWGEAAPCCEAALVPGSHSDDSERRSMLSQQQRTCAAIAHQHQLERGDGLVHGLAGQRLKAGQRRSGAVVEGHAGAHVAQRGAGRRQQEAAPP